MGRLEHLFVGRQRQLLVNQMLGLLLVRSKRGEQEVGIAVFKVVGRLLNLVLLVYIAVAQTICPCQVVDVVHTL